MIEMPPCMDKGIRISVCNGYNKLAKQCETQTDQLKQLAEVLLEAHSGQCNYCPYTMSQGDCVGKACGCSQAGFGCYCPDCTLAREILGGKE